MAPPSSTKITEDFLKKKTGEYDLEVMQWLELPNMGADPSTVLYVRAWLLFPGNLESLTSLQSLDLKDNQISSVDDVGNVSKLPHLRRFFLQDYKGLKSNPACQHPSYHSVVTRFLPQLDVLDGESLNLRKCMVDVILGNAKPNDEALKSPERRRWCEGFDWTPDFVDSDVEEDIRSGTEALHENGCCKKTKPGTATFQRCMFVPVRSPSRPVHAPKGRSVSQPPPLRQDRRQASDVSCPNDCEETARERVITNVCGFGVGWNDKERHGTVALAESRAPVLNEDAESRKTSWQSM
ncbi:unnamed protein product [Ectocarpus sp. 6 AP-2014]